MRQRLWIWGLVTVALALWLGPTILTAPGSPIRMGLTSDLSIVPPMERVSEAGVPYGHCIGVVLTVVLYPEPCDWDPSRRDRNVASR